MKEVKRSVCIAGSYTSFNRQGGVESQTRTIARALREAGWIVHFLTPGPTGTTGREKPVEVEPGVLNWLYPDVSFSFQVQEPLLRNILKRMDPTVVYQRGRSILQESGAVLRYCKVANIPFLFGLSSDADLDLFSGVSALMSSNKVIWKRAALLPYALTTDGAMRKTLMLADRVIVQHEAQQERFAKRFKRSARLLRTTHQEIDHPPVKEEPPLIAWVTNYRPWKQGELFLRLAGDCTDLAARFRLVYGRTKPEYIQPLLERGKQLPNLTMTGEMLPEDVERLLEESAIFVNTSLPLEGFPNTFVQAWLRETPTASLLVDPGGAIAREGLGLVGGNYDNLLKGVRDLIQTKELRRDIGIKARAYAEREHGYRVNAENIRTLFEEAASGKRSNRT